jgi:PIN domain nuclease of toxin-antitoxin system
MSPILLDTHAAVWAAEGQLSKSASAVVDEAASRSELLISPISAWEIGMLVQKKRLELAMSVEDYVRALFARPGVVTAAVTPATAVGATNLPGDLHADPADRILVATAASLGARLLTRDRRLHAYARATRHIHCLNC